MKRQIVLFALVAVLIPFFPAFAAEPPGKVWKIGNLVPSTPSVNAPRDEALRQGPRELGYEAGKSTGMEYKYAEAKVERWAERPHERREEKPDVIRVASTP